MTNEKHFPKTIGQWEFDYGFFTNLPRIILACDFSPSSIVWYIPGYFLPLQLIPIPLIQFDLFKLLKAVVLEIECYVITMAIKLQLELIFKELSATQVSKRSSKTTFFYSESILYIRNLESRTLGKQEGFYSKKHRLHRHHSLGREQ